MKFSHLLCPALLCGLLVGCSTVKTHPPLVPKTTFSSFDQPVPGVAEKTYGPGEINFKGLPLDSFLTIYQETTGRNVIRAGNLSYPSITLLNRSRVTHTEAIQLFDTTLAQHGIAMVLSGEKSVKAVPVSAACQEAGPVIDLQANQLPDSGSFMVRIIHLKRMKPSELVPVVQPFVKVPNGIIAMDRERVLVLRDFSANIRQMLKLIEVAEAGGR
jgi:type II secretory pathway component GspD/PulD (secretin)